MTSQVSFFYVYVCQVHIIAGYNYTNRLRGDRDL